MADRTLSEQLREAKLLAVLEDGTRLTQAPTALQVEAANALDAMQAQVERLKALLLQVEFGENDHCPVCGGIDSASYTHVPDCKLNATLRAEAEK